MRVNVLPPGGPLVPQLHQILASIEAALRRLDVAKQAAVTDFTAPAAYSPQTAEAAYTQATIQTLMDTVKHLHTVVTAIVTDLNAGS